MREEIFRLDSVTKKTDGITLLDDFNLQIFKGEIMGLLPLNTHGIDALLEVLCHNTSLSHGRIYFNDMPMNFLESTPLSRNRVYIIEKTSKLSKNLTVADNIFVLRQGFKKYIINKKLLNAQVRIFTKELDITIDPNELVLNLTPFQCCIVELVKAVATGAKLIVLREISSFISSSDLIKFYEIIRFYCKKDLSFLYIGNHHEEAFKICDRVSLMRNGAILKVLNKEDFKVEKFLPYILDFCTSKSTISRDFPLKPLLHLENVFSEHLNGLNFSVKKGECIVILDINNTSLTDIPGLMNGNLKLKHGNIIYKNMPFSNFHAKNALENGICFISENPVKSLLFYDMSYLDNLCLLLNKKTSSLFLAQKIKKSVINEYANIIGNDIFSNDISNLEMKTLYSLIYYRIFLYNPDLVFCLQPFSGSDMYLRHHLISLLNQFKLKGISIVLLTVNISDTLVLADRLLLLSNGKLIRDYNKSDFNKIEPDIFGY